MDLLPDDVLAQVLSLVSLTDLFHLRLVCKRFAALALHPDVWRGRDIGDICALNQGERRATLCRAVRLAPCVFNMMVHFSSDFSEDFSKCSHTFTTACAARKLTICVSGGKGAMRAAALIRHHRDLGRLRKLHIIFINVSLVAKAVSKEHAIVLFDTLLSTPDLDVLFVRGVDDKIVATEFSPAILHSAVNASLTHVIFCLTPALECVFNFILDRHAATLKTVHLEADSIPTSSTLLLLAKIPHLSTLLCPMVPGIDALVACKSLKTITIFCRYPDDDEDDAATATLLRHAHQLQRVNLSCTFPFSIATELVTALASSGRSCVETLTLRIEGESTPQLMRELLSALSSLPALRRLYMNVPEGSIDGRALLAWAAGRAHPSRPLDVQLGLKYLID